MTGTRRATRADAEVIHRILLDAFEPFRDLYTPGAFDATVLDAERVRARIDEGPIWLAVLDDEPVGTFGVRADDAGYYLRGMGVIRAARGAGAGRALVDGAVEWIDQRAPRRTWLYTTGFLHAAIRLYERAGFVRIDEDPPTELHGTPLIGMERP